MPTSRPRKIASRTRIPYKIGWGLADILAASARARSDCERMLLWIECQRLDAKGRYDTDRLARLGELSLLVADLALEVGAIERLGSDARIGEYHGPNQDC